MRISKKYGRRVETSSPEIKEDLIVPERYKDEKLLEANQDVVANTDKELGQVQMKIDTGDYPPIRLKPYRTPIHKRKLVEEEVNEMLDSGLIERSRFPWSFPINIVEKKDGGHRFCVDFRQSNAITKPFTPDR